MSTSADLALARVEGAARAASRSHARWVGTLYLAEGVPSAVITFVSTLVLKRLGVGNADVTFYASALILPWILRPLWSPLLEAFRTYRFFVVALEGVVALAFAGAAAALGAGSPAGLVVALLAVVAVSAATHDMAADGIFIASLTGEEQPRYVGWCSVAFNAGKLGVQGLLVVLAGRLEVGGHVLDAWRVVFVVLAAVMAALALHHARALPEGRPRPPSESSPAPAALEVVRTFFLKPSIAWLLLLVLSYRLAEGQIVRIVPLFLLDPAGAGGLGLSTTQVGWLYGAFGAGAFMLGALLGGAAAARLGLERVLVGLCAAFSSPALLYLLLAWSRPRSLVVVAAAIAAEQLAYGMGSIGLKLLLMRALAAGPYPTAHFALAAGLCALTATGAGMLSGHLQAGLGYAGFFGAAALAALPALIAATVYARPRAPSP
jgi:PAT family beta-lactamase induction signal transducer AmpG